MIHAVIYQSNGKEYRGFRLSGHAGYAEHGQDIVCAAASVLVINTINAIERYTEDIFSISSAEESGSISCRFEGSPSREAELLLKAMVLGLSDMADDENYREYIDLTFKEV